MTSHDFRHGMIYRFIEMTDICISSYRILEEIGRGGMGRVFKAEDSRSGQMVAVKVIAEKHLADYQMVKRFEREGLVISSMKHPNICGFYEAGTWNDRPYIAMELLDGETVKDRIRRHELFKEGELISIAVQIAGALHAAHSVDILHRDIKPSNIFLNKCGRTKLLDFGMAKFIHRKPMPITNDSMATVAMSFATFPGTILGTVAYMSPEQARAEPLDLRTDLYSLGVVLHEMTTGELPLGRALSRQLPNWLEPIVRKLTAAMPADRYLSSSELRADLETVASSSGLIAGRSRQVAAC